MKLTNKQTNYRLMPIRTYVFISLHWETFSHNWKCLVFSFGTRVKNTSNLSDSYLVSEPVPLPEAQSLTWGSQILHKKTYLW